MRCCTAATATQSKNSDQSFRHMCLVQLRLFSFMHSPPHIISVFFSFSLRPSGCWKVLHYPARGRQKTAGIVAGLSQSRPLQSALPTNFQALGSEREKLNSLAAASLPRLVQLAGQIVPRWLLYWKSKKCYCKTCSLNDWTLATGSLKNLDLGDVATSWKIKSDTCNIQLLLLQWPSFVWQLCLPVPWFCWWGPQHPQHPFLQTFPCRWHSAPSSSPWRSRRVFLWQKTDFVRILFCATFPTIV